MCEPLIFLANKISFHNFSLINEIYFFLFKLENPLSRFIIQCRCERAVGEKWFLGTTFDELEWIYPFFSVVSLWKFSAAYFFFCCCRCRASGIKITLLKKVEFSIKNENQLKRSSIVIKVKHLKNSIYVRERERKK